ncbi:heterokaryon incompatibility protein-domain-containing protein [Xylaria digitata]|nr:heterokaryon incompatibility protein-domain-containing protein [Xylaria digitata]
MNDKYNCSWDYPFKKFRMTGIMANWHEASCRRPDVLVDASSSMSSCLNCGAHLLFAEAKSGNLTDTHTYQPIPIMPLSWPPSVEYSSSEPSVSVIMDWTAGLYRPDVIALNFSWESITNHNERFESNPFAYPSLTQSTHFRILRLSAGSPMDALHGWVEIVDSRHPIEYQAVSYPWADKTGDKSLCRRIFLGGHHQPLPITLNCFRALRHLRKRSAQSSLWIDAVCIDQQSPSERSHQVGLMSKIFSSATNVCVYSGNEDDIPEAMNAEAIKLLNMALQDDNYVVPRSRALEMFFNRPYFSRLWVVQEVLLARSLSFHCGMVSTKPIKRADLQPALVSNLPPLWMSLIDDMPETQRTTRGLLSVLATTYACEASDMRDKIFGLLGLIEDTLEKQLAPDYSLTIREVYIGTAAYLVQKHRSLNILNFAGLGHSGCTEDESTCLNHPRVTYGIPSWVPLWTRAPYDSASSFEEMTSQRNQFKSETESYALSRNLGPPKNIHVTALTPSMFIDRQKGDIVGQTDPDYKAKVDGDTGALIVEGRMVVGVLPKLVRQEPLTAMPQDEIREVMDEEDAMMRKCFYHFPGGAVIGLKLPKHCRYAQDKGMYQVLALHGYDYFLVAVPYYSSIATNSFYYEVVGPCQIVMVCSLSTKPPSYQSVGEWILAIEEFFPMTVEKIRFLVEWRRILQPQVGDEKLGSGHELYSPGWTTNFHRAELTWQRYCNLKLQYTEANTCERDEVQTEILNLLEFWQAAEFNRVKSLVQYLKRISECDNFLKANESLYATCPDWGSVNVNGEHNSISGFTWGTRFSEALKMWLRERKSLIRLLQNLPGVDIVVRIHNGKDITIDENFVKDIYDELCSLPSKARDKKEIDKQTRQLLMDRDFCWRSLDMCLDFLKSTPLYLNEVESMLALARDLQLKGKYHDIVIY